MMTSDTNGRPDTSHARPLAGHPLVFFFLIAYAAAWLVWAPVVLSETGAGLLTFTIPPHVVAGVIAAGTFAPTLSAFIMTGITEGRVGIHRLLRRYVLWRVKFRWYAFVLLIIPASEVLGAIALPGFRYRTNRLRSLWRSLIRPLLSLRLSSEGHWAKSPAGAVCVTSLNCCVARCSEVSSWDTVGLVALPLFWSGVWTPPTIPNVVMFISMITALTIVMTWVFNNAKGSLLITMLMHASLQHIRQQDSGAGLSGSHSERVSTLAGAGWVWGGGVAGCRLDPGPPGLPTLPARRRI